MKVLEKIRKVIDLILSSACAIVFCSHGSGRHLSGRSTLLL